LKRLGLIINPVAGMGGRVGLKGTDGAYILEKAKAMGAKPQSQVRAREALEHLEYLKDRIKIITCPTQMGEETAVQCGFLPDVIENISRAKTTASDTQKAAKEMQRLGVDLLLFAGGDGTARDIYEIIGESLVVLGIPAGVKIHSAVYARSPSIAGDLTSLFLQGKAKNILEAEVMDIDEEDYRKGILSAKLCGYLKIPFKRRFVQCLKAGSPVSEKYAQEAIAHEIVENMTEEFCYIVGPGTTTRAIMDKLGLDHSLLGIDCVFARKLIGKDLSESRLLDKIKGKKAKLIITPIGGQGFLLGRGNQPVSPEVINHVSKDNIIIIATKQKMSSLQGRPFLVDTGDKSTDNLLSGYYEVITGHKESLIYKVIS